MNLPIYREVFNSHLSRNGNGHAGLWFDRFFSGYDSEWKRGDKEKKRFMDNLNGPVGNEEAINRVAKSQMKLCKDLHGEARVYKSCWHFITGMGYPHPAENGFLWHPTLGTPYLPGSAVKGMLRAYMEAWAEESSLEILHRWFGSEDKNPVKRERPVETGAYIFFDAIPTKTPSLKTDIMTPHMGKWYEQGGDIGSAAAEPEKVPADWHDPVPISFLVAEQISLLFIIIPRDSKAKSELKDVMKMLGSAIEWIGAGAKTAVGYGQMENDLSHSLLLSTLSPEDWCRQKIKMLDDKKIAEMFGKRHKKTKKCFESHKIPWQKVLDILLELKGDVIKQWGEKEKNTQEKNAFVRLCKEVPELKQDHVS